MLILLDVLVLSDLSSLFLRFWPQEYILPEKEWSIHVLPILFP